MTTAAPIHTVAHTAPKPGGNRYWRDLLALTIIFALNWICYVRVINGYFLADDFLHVTYLKNVFAGDWFALARNFWSNWMQTQGTSFYRPIISLTLAADYFIFGPNAAGFHLSNVLYQICVSLALYFVVKELGLFFQREATSDSEEERSRAQNRAFWSALVAATLFSVNPLHGEVVIWITSRVDSVSCMFYLAAIALHLKSRHHVGKRARYLHIASLVNFALALGSKEMAIVLPPALTLLHWLSPVKNNGEKKEAVKGFRHQFFYGIKQTLPFWLVFIAFMVIRTLALGTITGGYQGSIGEGLASSITRRWLEDGSLLRLLFPLNIDVFGPNHGLYKELKILYIVAAVSFVAAFIFAKDKLSLLRATVFGLGWFVLSLLPTYQVWSLTESLQGNRYAYFASVPIAYLLALAVIPPIQAAKAAIDRFLLPLRLVLATFFIIAFATITARNNGAWIHAMQELKTFQAALCRAAENDPDKNLVVLNIPQRYRGAHMLYNAATMSVMFSPPLAAKDIVERVYTFEPAMYGQDDLINVSRLRRLNHHKDKFLIYSWNRDKLILEPLDFKDATETDGSIAAEQILFENSHGGLTLAPGMIVQSPPLQLQALYTDAITVQFSEASLKALKADPVGKDAVLDLIFKDGSLAMPILKNLQNNKLTFELSEHKIWLRQNVVDSLSFKTIGYSLKLDIEKITAKNYEGRLPVLKPDGRDLVEGADGICRIKGPRPTFSYDVTTVPGAVGAICEVSKANSWFEDYTGSLRDTKVSPEAMSTNTLSKLTGRNIPLSFAGALGSGYYQIKVAAVDKDGKVLEYFSDPLNFQK